MTAQTAQTPRLRRGLPFLAVAALIAPLAGCVTVHAEQLLVPAVEKYDAVKALDDFATVNNEANSKLDSSLNARIETGALGAIDQAGIKAGHALHPDGNSGYQPLRFSDVRFLIPEQRGWPKWFVADAASNRDDRRWLLVFTRGSVNEAWRASYLSVIPRASLPEFATDSAGYVEPVAPDDFGLLVPPGRLSGQYATYLEHDGKGSTVFADGVDTSGVVEQRRTNYAPTPQVVTQFADEPADPRAYPPVALRLKDGGALVFFTSHHQMKQTIAKGPLSITEPDVNALMTGTPNTAVTLVRVAEQAVRVPPASTADGKVVFLDRIDGLISAQGS